MSEPSRRGRRKLAHHAQRCRTITVRTNSPEYSYLRERADQSTEGRLSTYLRKMGLEGIINITAPPPIENIAAYDVLRRIGQNLNQQVKQIHQGKAPPDNRALLLEVQRLLKENIRLLLGGKNHDHPDGDGGHDDREDASDDNDDGEFHDRQND